MVCSLCLSVSVSLCLSEVFRQGTCCYRGFFDVRFGERDMGGSAMAINVLDDNVAKHGEEESRDGQHFRKGIGIASALLEGGSGVGQEMDQRRSQEDAACELRPQQQEGVIPPEEVRRDPTHESRNENNNQAINLHKNQPLGSQILRPYNRRRSIISNKPHRLLIRMSPTMRLNSLHRKQNTHKNHYPYHHFSPTHHLLPRPHHHPDKNHFQFLKKNTQKTSSRSRSTFFTKQSSLSGPPSGSNSLH